MGHERRESDHMSVTSSEQHAVFENGVRFVAFCEAINDRKHVDAGVLPVCLKTLFQRRTRVLAISLSDSDASRIITNIKLEWASLKDSEQGSSFD
jgi:hypothetical protein